MVQIVFYIFALITCGAALFIVITKNVMHAAFALLVTLLGLAGLYVLAGADFISISQIVVYVGGILVLLIFGMMLTQPAFVDSLKKQQIPASKSQYIALSAFFALGLLAVLLYVFYLVDFESLDWIQKASAKNNLVLESTVEPMGILLMTRFILPFEIIALLLLLALIGSTSIAGKDKNQD